MNPISIGLWRCIIACALSHASVFAQDDPAFLTHPHTDLRVVFTETDTYKLAILVRNSDAGINYRSNEVVLVATEAAKLALPYDLPPLGQAGKPVWILPATQNPEVLFLGLSGDGLGPGMFEGPVKLLLKAVKGPGQFFLWQAGVGGVLDFQMDTTDGITEADHVEIHAGGHGHHNWGFTAPGMYCVTLEAVGKRTGVVTNDTSLETPITFYVEPLPTEPPFEVWQREHWPTCQPESISGPEGDPDADGVPNLLEYAFGLDPEFASSPPRLSLALVDVDDARYGAVAFTRAKIATDLSYTVVAANGLLSPSWAPLTIVFSLDDQGTTELVTIRDNLPVGSGRHRFYQLWIELR